MRRASLCDLCHANVTATALMLMLCVAQQVAIRRSKSSANDVQMRLRPLAAMDRLVLRECSSVRGDRPFATAPRRA